MDGIIAAVYYLFKSVEEFQSTKNKKDISLPFVETESYFGFLFHFW